MLRGSVRKTIGRTAGMGLGRDDIEGLNSARLTVDRATRPFTRYLDSLFKTHRNKYDTIEENLCCLGVTLTKPNVRL